MKRFLLPLIILLASCSPNSIDLAGDWKFQIDRENIGETQNWFTKSLIGDITLPGSMASNGLGDEITLDTKWVGGMRNPEWHTDPNYAPYHDPDNIRIPYWLQPEKKYTGAAWYQKEIKIPKSWKDKPVKLHLERAHWETTVWFDDIKIGTQNSLATAHEYILTKQASSGKHLITIRVDNRTKDVDVGWDSHSISDHTQSNWNGLVGELIMTPMATATIQSFRIITDIDARKILVEGVIFNSGENDRKAGGQEGRKAKVIGRVEGSKLEAQIDEIEIDILHGENSFSMVIDLDEKALLWDEFDPNLYTLELTLDTGYEKSKLTETFGLRKIEADSSGLKINHRPAFLRGTLECAIFPLTGYPSTNPEEWIRIMRVIKEHGLNHIRFHSWCPPEAAFVAADEVGVYLQVECSSWANSTTRIGDGLPIDQFIWDESQDIIRNYGNHPSFIMMAYGNEPAGNNQNAFLTEFVSYWKENDPRRLYTSAAGWPRLPVNDFHNIPQPRIQGWGEQLNSIINAKPPSTNYDWTSRLPKPESRIPVVSHEIGQWCVYPNLKETEKYTGVLKAKNFEIFKESLEANHMGHLADSFLLASGKLQALCYKAEIEAALRTPNFGGFQLLDLHDFPGQGTALVGILDPFWEEKGYISPEEFSHFCNTTVPLARLSKRIFLEGETIEAPVKVAHFDKEELRMQNAEWRIFSGEDRLQNEKIIAGENFPEQTIPIGNKHYLGTINHTFKKTGKPRKLTLEVSISKFSNSWDLWVYPESPELTSERSKRESPISPVQILTNLNPENLKKIEKGGTVLLSLGKGKVSPEWGGDIGVGFSSIFWNTAWTGGQKPHTLGILCNPEHPAMSEFPSEYHSNWQWWDAMSHADAIKLNNMPVELKPIVRIVDDWVTNRRLALLFEAKVGKGKILVSGIDLHTNMDERPEARQLLHSLMKYIASEKFDPKVEIEAKVLKEMVAQ